VRCIPATRSPLEELLAGSRAASPRPLPTCRCGPLRVRCSTTPLLALARSLGDGASPTVAGVHAPTSRPASLCSPHLGTLAGPSDWFAAVLEAHDHGPEALFLRSPSPSTRSPVRLATANGRVALIGQPLPARTVRSCPRRALAGRGPRLRRASGLLDGRVALLRSRVLARLLGLSPALPAGTPGLGAQGPSTSAALPGKPGAPRLRTRQGLGDRGRRCCASSRVRWVVGLGRLGRLSALGGNWPRSDEASPFEPKSSWSCSLSLTRRDLDTSPGGAGRFLASLWLARVSELSPRFARFGLRDPDSAGLGLLGPRAHASGLLLPLERSTAGLAPSGLSLRGLRHDPGVAGCLALRHARGLPSVWPPHRSWVRRTAPGPWLEMQCRHAQCARVVASPLGCGLRARTRRTSLLSNCRVPASSPG
jgi:hypothetical protein